MEWFEAIVGALGGGLLTLVSAIVYFRPKLKEARAEAQKVEAEANAATFEHLMERINNMDKLYAEQSKMIDELRKQVLDLGQEVLERDKQIQSLSSENKENKAKIEELTRQLEAYRVITNK